MMAEEFGEAVVTPDLGEKSVINPVFGVPDSRVHLYPIPPAPQLSYGHSALDSNYNPGSTSQHLTEIQHACMNRLYTLT
jgi:hypothetical protein